MRSTLLASAAIFVSPFSAEAQTERSSLPPVTVTAPEQKRAAARPSAARCGAVGARRSGAQSRQHAPSAQRQGQGGRGALAVLSAQQALTEINNTPGGVAIVPAEAYRNSTVANTIKDILDYVPGVFAQPKWGDDTRLSIRGSGLSRNFHLRGIQLYMDGIPINTADGYGDFQEIDPTAYKYVEVYKGANALQFGANSLGGAINFVMPTGRDPFPNGASVDIGAFGFKRLQANAGGANGPWDGFVTAVDAGRRRLPRPQFRQRHPRQRQCRLPVLAGCRDAVLLQRQRGSPAHPRRRHQAIGADQSRSRRARQRRQRLAAQHRHRAARQQDHDPASTTPRSSSAPSASTAI